MVKEEPIQQAVAAILSAIGEDPSREGLKDTPRRVARMYGELFSGVGVDPREALSSIFEETGSGPVVVRGVAFFSVCEHHLLPFFGVTHLGYIPKGKIAGVSKLVRAVEIVAHRPQVQERMTAQLADAIFETLDADGVAVVVEAEHLCMSMRGVKKAGCRIVTSATRGPFSSLESSRAEFLALLQRS